MEAKVKVWLEDDKENLIFGGGKTQILEYIDQSGSIAKAAEMLGMNYKKAWTHIKILQEYIDDELVIVQKGRNSGGTVLTAKAKEIIANYKQLQSEVKEFTSKRFDELFSDSSKIITCSKEEKNV